MTLTKVRAWYVLTPTWVRILAAGIFCGLGFITGYAAPLLLIGLILLIHLLDQSKSIGQSILIGWGVWFFQSLFVDAWFWHTYPIDWVPFDSTVVELVVIGFHWVTIALWLSSTGLVVGLGYWYIRQQSWPLWLHSGVVATVVVVAEQVSALVFSIATIGPGILPNTYFGLGFLGNVVSHIPFLISYAFFGGVYILSWLVIGYVVVVVAWSRAQAWIKVVALTISLLVVGFVLQVTLIDTHSRATGTVAVISTDFTARLLQDEAGHEMKQAALEAAVLAAYEQAPDYMLLPEDSRYIENAYPGVTPERAFGYHRFVFGDPTTILIDTGRVDLPNGTAVQRATVFNGLTKSVSYQEKQYLAPQGEYISYAYEAVFRLLGYGSVVDSAKLKQSYRPGTSLSDPKDITIPILFCFASVNPRGLLSLKATVDTPFVAHPISHAWFHTPYILWHQLDTALRIQAVWNQMIIISAANGAESLVYIPDGSITVGEVVATGDLWEVRIINLKDL